MHPKVMSATTLIGDGVVNSKGEDLGELVEIMLDLNTGQVAYAVLSFGGFLGLGDKLIAIPWQALSLDTENKVFVLGIDQEKLENAPGFDQDNWPETDKGEFITEVYTFYGFDPYWS